MKKLILKFWIMNVLISIALFIIYRIVISEAKSVDETLFEKFISILEIFLNVGFSLLYLAGILISSFVIFLNLFKTIRTNLYWSLLTFLGLPSVFIIYLITDIWAIRRLNEENILTRLFTFLVIYLICNAIEFTIFRRKIQLHCNKI